MVPKSISDLQYIPNFFFKDCFVDDVEIRLALPTSSACFTRQRSRLNHDQRDPTCAQLALRHLKDIAGSATSQPDSISPIQPGRNAIMMRARHGKDENESDKLCLVQRGPGCGLTGPCSCVRCSFHRHGAGSCNMAQAQLCNTGTPRWIDLDLDDDRRCHHRRQRVS